MMTVVRFKCKVEIVNGNNFTATHISFTHHSSETYVSLLFHVTKQYEIWHRIHIIRRISENQPDGL